MDGKSSFSKSIDNDKKSSSSSSFYSSDEQENLQSTPSVAAVADLSKSDKQSFKKSPLSRKSLFSKKKESTEGTQILENNLAE